MRKSLAIAGTGLKRFLRERENVFFVFIFPILIIMFIGLQFGSGNSPTLAVVGADTPVGTTIVERISEDGFSIVEAASREDAIGLVERSEAQAAVVVADGDPVTSTEPIAVEFMAREGFGLDLRSAVQAAVTDESADLRAARYVSQVTGLAPADAAVAVGTAGAAMEQITVSVSRGGEPLFEGEMGQFDLGASSQLVLFTFLTSMSTSGHLILSRKLGVAGRMLVSPTSVRSIVLGEALGRYSIALVQALFIVVATSIMFGVDWGEPLGSAAMIGLFSLTATAAGILLGSLANNDQQASGLGVMLGIGLGALGGAMVPYELFPDLVQRISSFTPHYWALRGFRQLLFNDGGIADVGPELGALALFAAGLLLVASWAYRRAITA